MAGSALEWSKRPGSAGSKNGRHLNITIVVLHGIIVPRYLKMIKDASI